MITLGIIADTHIPDRANSIHPDILSIFANASVKQILHAGDITSPSVLRQLRTVAPVTAVRGNRDLIFPHLRMVENITVEQVPIALMHGHGGLWPYLLDKWKYWHDGYQLDRYTQKLMDAAGAARVIIFGHTHHAELRMCQGKLLFNPGSASFGFIPGSGSSSHLNELPPSVGLLHIAENGAFRGEIIPLTGYKIKRRIWVKILDGK